MGKFYRRIFNFWIVLATFVAFSTSVHSIGDDCNEKERPSLEELLLENDEETTNIEKKIGKLGLKRTEEVNYSSASWYGPHFHGKPTASAEPYNRNLLTAAHKSLPLNTYILVTNMNNGREIIVRVNDRGPFIAGRDIDLSEVAAKMIDAIPSGVVPIKYEILATK